MIQTNDAVDHMRGHKPLDRWPKKIEEIRRMEVKEDGWRLVIFKADGLMQAITRNGENVWPKIKPRFSDLADALPDNSMLDGELILSNGPASAIPTRLKSRDLDDLVYVVLCCPVWKGEPKQNAFFVHDLLIDDLENRVPSVRRANSTNIVTDYDLPSSDALKLRAKKEGHEGYVLKETPLFGWYKVKPTYTVDMVVDHVVEGTGRNKGRAGALVCKLIGAHENEYSHVTKVGGGLSDRDRKLWWINREHAKNAVVEVEFQAVLKNSLQFPRFVRLREDKSMYECTAGQLEGARRQ